MRPVRHFAPCCTAGLQYADRRRLCGAYAGARYFCAQPRYPRALSNKQLSFAAEMGVFESGTPYRGAACRVGKLYPRNCFHGSSWNAGIAAIILCVCAMSAESPLFLWKTMCRNLCSPGIDAYDFARRSLYDVFETVYHERIIKSRRVLMAQTANAEFANLIRRTSRFPRTVCRKHSHGPKRPPDRPQ